MRSPYKVFTAIDRTEVSAKTGRILASTRTGATQDASRVEWWQHVGFISRPSKPSDTKPDGTGTFCQGIGFEGPSQDIIIASQDARGLVLLGNLREGETAAYAGGEFGLGQARTLWRDDGSVTSYTTDTNRAGGAAIYARMATGTDENGLPDGFRWVAPWGTIKFDHTGFHIQHISGAEFHLGGISGMPAPLDQISTYCHVVAGAFNAEVTGSSHGAGPPVPFANAVAVLSALTAMQAQIAAITATITAVAAAVSSSNAGAVAAAASLPATIATNAATIAAAALVTNTTTTGNV